MDCTTCPRGFYCSVANKLPIACAAGTYRAKRNQIMKLKNEIRISAINKKGERSEDLDGSMF